MTFLIAFVLGAAVGSFLNVCVYRIPIGESIAWPPSRCMSCRRAVSWFDNIPILSFFILKAKCRHCGGKISAQYPAVELAAAVLFVLFYAVFGLTAVGVCYLALSLLLLTQGIIDWRHQIIPDVITIPGILLGITMSSIFPALQGEATWQKAFLNSLFGVVLGGGVLFLLGTAAEKILKKEAMGGGDVKLLAMIGAFLGWSGVFWTLFLGSLLGSIVGIYRRAAHGEEKLAFGPYMGAAAFLYLFWGGSFFGWYFQWMKWTP